jgi:SSS family solute:Na+ symporter
VVYVFGSLASNPTDPEVLAEWDRRSRGESTAKITVQQTSSA